MVGSPLEDLVQGDTPDNHKLAIGQCVIEWARAESQLRALLTMLEGRKLDEGAKDYKRLSPENAWKRIKTRLIERSASLEVVEAIQKNRTASRVFYETRKHVVHSGLVGWRKSDPDYLAFAPFESDSPGEMVFLWIPIEDIKRSASFAHATGKMASRIMEQIEPIKA